MKWVYKLHQSVQKLNQKRHQNNNTIQASTIIKILKVVRSRKNNKQNLAVQKKMSL